jgi:cytochrome oxidase assembly protein ShyY1
MSIIFFSVILILGLDIAYSKDNKEDGSCINYILSIKTSENNIVLEKSTISKISELVNSQIKLKASFLIHISNKNKYYLALPSTSKSTFLNLIQSPNLHFDITTLKSTAYQELITNNTIPVLINSTKTVQIGSESNMGNNSFLNYLINWFEIPFIHLYLLFLIVVLVSFDLFTKFRIIKK